MNMSDKQLCENDARDFLGDDYWKACKRDYDELMSYRKSLKGKPTEEQMFNIKLNAIWITHYDTILWHSSIMSDRGRCGCARCAVTRKKV